MEKKYIIKAEYSALPYYIGKDENNNIFMEKLRAWNIYDNDFGYTLDEAKQIMKMYKAYEKKKYKEWQEYMNEFKKHNFVVPTWSNPYIAKKYYLARKNKLKNSIELKRTTTGKYQYYWKKESNEK